MEVLFNPQAQKLPYNFMTVGAFDGLHLGHKGLIEKLVELGKKHQMPSVVLTFEPHPRVFFGEKTPFILSALNQKIALLDAWGVDFLIICTFDQALSELSAQDYLSHFLYQKLAMRGLLLGADHRFGKARAGNIATVKKMQPNLGFELQVFEPLLIENSPISATLVREKITQKDFEAVQKLLGRPYQLTAKVEKGKQLGRVLGYPTANLSLFELQMHPPLGVYGVRVVYRGKSHFGMLNIGFAPTFNELQKIKIEVHLFEFQQEIYGEELKVDFLLYHRAEKKFENVVQLKQQLVKDAIEINQKLNKIKGF